MSQLFMLNNFHKVERIHVSCLIHFQYFVIVLFLHFHLQLFTNLFKNNANVLEGSDRRHNHNCFMEMVTVDGMYDYMMYVGK